MALFFNQLYYFFITDSFIFQVSYDLEQTPQCNFWRDYAKMAPQLDFHSYDPLSHPLFLNNPEKIDYLLYYQRQNSKMPGKFKDELDSRECIAEVSD